MTPAELLREAANRIEAPRYTDAGWLNVLAYGDGADAAPLLAAWLRAEAEQQDDLPEGEICPGTVCAASLAFARSILQEEP